MVHRFRFGRSRSLKINTKDSDLITLHTKYADCDCQSPYWCTHRDKEYAYQSETIMNLLRVVQNLKEKVNKLENRIEEMEKVKNGH